MISDNKKAFYCLGKKRLCCFWLYRFELIRNGSKMNETVVSPLGHPHFKILLLSFCSNPYVNEMNDCASSRSGLHRLIRFLVDCTAKKCEICVIRIWILWFAYAIIVYFQILYLTIKVSCFLQRENQCTYIVHWIFSRIKVKFLRIHFINHFTVDSQRCAAIVSFYLNCCFFSRIHFVGEGIQIAVA